MKDKFVTYLIAQKLAKFPINSTLEHYRDALNRLKSLIDIHRSEAIQLDTTGVMTLDYIINRITQSYKASIQSNLDKKE
ncbi:hypothetical protein DL89DRAFT_264293 [Linderina pennispora]|uniref:Uncharacterized protein n=1 Tax=Linderina pennispora TaxID=61395 RepID=A0A1Y1WLH6_9FUNG|nr:uncharacterized protein DL89DRAFT_264293 [Linderina pennispora]ORX74419.1 hypothetical protein DL89DRAFT_264293 [Linderina pennispora]